MVSIKYCRSCGSEDLIERLNLGKLAIIKFKHSEEEPDEKAPLTLLQCQKCTLVQLSETVNRDKVFREYYYKSGINQTMRDELLDIVTDGIYHARPEPGDWVLDIGSNDGTLLGYYPRNVHTLGFEPSNLASHQYSITIPNFFSAEAAKKFAPKFKIVTAIAMFYSVEDPNKFLQDVKEILAEDGVFILQVNDIENILTELNIGDICHEHVFYFSLLSLNKLLTDNKLYVKSWSHNGTNGGSIRLVVTTQFHDFETTDFEYDWEDFSSRLKRQSAKIEKFMWQLFSDKKTVWGYGASTRWNTVMQYIPGAALLEAIADKNPRKIGRFMAGTNIAIESEKEMRERKPDYVVISNPSFIDEFVDRESKFLESGGKFLVLLPELQEISKDGRRTL